MFFKVFSKVACLSLISILCFSRECFSQIDIDLNPENIHFESEEARKIFEKIPKSSLDVLRGLAPAPTYAPGQMAKLKEFSFITFIKEHKIERDSPEWEYHKKRLLEDVQIEMAVQPGDKAPTSHYRFKGGQPIPTQSDIEQEIRKKLARIAAKPIKVRQRKAKVPQAAPQIEEDPVVNKPICAQSMSVKLPIPEDYIVAGEQADILFLNRTPPFDIKTAVGSNTGLIIFGEKDKASEASMYLSLPISCVPFRLRSTGTEVTYSHGIDALKNYDANPGSNGTLDPTVKKYIEQTGLK